MIAPTDHVVTLANSIIGVSVLAMPFCFQQCGIVLSILMLILSSIASRLACHFLLRSALIVRRKTFEFLAFYVFGSYGKLFVEIGMIGFLMGSCVAFFVIIGDLLPNLVAKIVPFAASYDLRCSVMVVAAFGLVLPLSMLKQMDSLKHMSAATLAFYFALVLKVVLDSSIHIVSGKWLAQVNWWRPEGILQCIPIFAMALFCQTQLFEIYDSLPNPTLSKMNEIVRFAVNICTAVYVLVGAFGYIAYPDKTITGNVLVNFEQSTSSDFMKIGFAFSVIFSFPLIIFPCRRSLHSLVYKQVGFLPHDAVNDFMPERRFRLLTFLIVTCSLVIGMVSPNIEFVLGLIGSTIGVMICVLFPVTCFVIVSKKNTNERIIAQVMLFFGILVMFLGTYANIRAAEDFEAVELASTQRSLLKNVPQEIVLKLQPAGEGEGVANAGQEPPPPLGAAEPNQPDKPQKVTASQPVDEAKDDLKNGPREARKDDDAVAIDAQDLVKEKEKLMETLQKQEILLDEQQKLLKEMKKEHDRVKILAKEKLKAVKNIEEIAKKAIQSIGADSEPIVTTAPGDARNATKNKTETKSKAPAEKAPEAALPAKMTDSKADDANHVHSSNNENIKNPSNEPVAQPTPAQ